MRTYSALDALFPGLRQGILTATFTQSTKWWYLSELAGFLHTSPSSLQRELAVLVEGGILKQRREGTRKYFKAETQSPIFADLQRIFEKTAGLVPMLRASLKSFDKSIACAFVYGSVARHEEGAGSDVDLMVIGETGLAELSPILRKAENRLGREINITNYSVDEFRKRVSQRDHFLTRVLTKGKLQFVKGEQRDLDAITGKQRSKTA